MDVENGFPSRAPDTVAPVSGDHHRFCPCCGGSAVLDADTVFGAPSEASTAGSMSDLADYLTTGFWADGYGWGPRWFNMTATGVGANNGSLHWNMDGFSGVTTQFGTYSDASGITDTSLRSAIRDAFAMYEAVLGINFVETSQTDKNVDIFIGNAAGGNFAAHQPVTGNDGVLDHAYVNLTGDSSGPGDNYFTTILHEIGHVLGLGHQGDYNGISNFASDAIFLNDSDQLSLMSYWEQNENPHVIASQASPVTLQSADLLALDALYGGQGYGTANAFLGDTIYGFGSNLSLSDSPGYADLARLAANGAFTLVDGGGKDKIDLSNFRSDQAIDLRVPTRSTITTGAGFGKDIGVSNVGGRVGNMVIGVGVVIEEAISGTGNDTVLGNDAENMIIGGLGDDSLRGNGGNDTIIGQSGQDTLSGGAGADTFVYSNGETAHPGEFVFGDTGYDRILLTGTDGDVFDLTGIQVNSLEEIEFSPDGADVDRTLLLDSQEFDSATEFSRTLRIDGNNSIGSTEYLQINMSTLNLDISRWIFQDWGAQGERITILGSALGNRIATSSKTDSVMAGEGDDTVTAGIGRDTVRGGAGNDHLSGQEGDDRIYGDDGDDSLVGGDTDAGKDHLYGGAGNDTLDGGDGDDLLIAATSPDGANMVTADHLTGGNGNDTLHGSDGQDTLAGGAGDDLLRGNAGDDQIDGGTGNDTVDYTAATSGVSVNLAAGTATGGDGQDTLLNVENVTGSALHNDSLIGRSGANLLSGLGGDDTLDDGAGADTVLGGTGNDRLIAGEGLINGDTYDGGAGVDTFDLSAQTWTSAVTIDLLAQTWSQTVGSEALLNVENIEGGGGLGEDLRGSNLANTINGRGGDDRLLGRGGNDRLNGGTGQDTVNAGAGDDLVSHTDWGSDRYDGGLGNDTVASTLFFSTGTVIDLAAGTFRAGGPAQIWRGFESYTGLGAGHETVFGSTDGNRLQTGIGNNRINGLAGDDTIIAGGGHDTIDAGTGTDSVDAGAGNDRVFYRTLDGDSYDGGLGTDTVSTELTFAAGTVIDLLAGSVRAGSVTANWHGFESYVSTGSGHEKVYGGQDANALTTGAGDNLLVGRSGDDTLIAGTGNDTLNGGSGNDRLCGQGGNDVLLGGAGADDLNGGGGQDTLSFQGDTVGVTVDLSINSATGGNANGDTITGFEHVLGTRGDDSLTGTAEANTLSGSQGNDVLVGLAGNDQLMGDGGHDTLIGGAGDDRLIGHGGRDLIQGGDGADTLNGGGSVDTLSYVEDTVGVQIDLDANTATGGHATGDVILGFERLTGGYGDDRLFGSVMGNFIDGGDGDDSIDGRTGNDVLHGGDGQDSLVGGGDNDALFGGADNDSLSGGDGDDRLNGGTGNDTLFGQAENDTLWGFGGADRLLGGYGNDTVSGGAGADEFVYYAGQGIDLYTDFQTGIDRLLIDDAMWIGATGALAPSEILARFASDTGADILFDFGGGQQIRLQNLADLTGLDLDIVII